LQKFSRTGYWFEDKPWLQESWWPCASLGEQVEKLTAAEQPIDEFCLAVTGGATMSARWA
jgi:hypothetical protein